MNAKELITTYQSTFGAKNVSLGDMGNWIQQSRESLAGNQDDIVQLAYLLGRAEMELRTLMRGYFRGVKIHHGMCEVDEQRNACLRVFELRRQRAEAPTKTVALDVNVSERQLRRWLKKYFPAGDPNRT